MKLEWLGECRELVEQIIRYSNVYARKYKRSLPVTGGGEITPEEVQVLEYILENEERQEKMTQLAQRLGISASTFTKLAARLQKRGLLEKYRRQGNDKDIIVVASPAGRELYNRYAQDAFQQWAKRARDLLSCVPQEHIERLTELFRFLSTDNEAPQDPASLIKMD